MDTLAHNHPTRPVRRPPCKPLNIVVPFAGLEALCEEEPAGPIELTFHATDADGQLAVWFDDIWWTELVERWSDRQVALCLAATPAALLHPVVLHELEMVSRIAPRWRVVGHGYRSDVSSDNDVEVLARSPYHEVRFFDQDGPDAKIPPGGEGDRSLAELFRRVREEQALAGTKRPVLVRLPAAGSECPTSSATTADMTPSKM